MAVVMSSAGGGGAVGGGGAGGARVGNRAGAPVGARAGVPVGARAGAPVVTRALVVWCPDWPITAALHASDLPVDTPLALVDRNLVFACSASARAEGVKRGLRIREAQSRCTQLEVLPYDPVLDARAFDPVLAAI